MIPVTYQESLKRVLLDMFKTNNVIWDAIITTCILSLFGYVLQVWNNMEEDKWKHINKYLSYFYTHPNRILITGQNCTTPCHYGDLTISHVYSNRFEAILLYLISHIQTKGIHEVKELYSNYQDNNADRVSKEVLSVCQIDAFSIDPDIFFKIHYETHTEEGKKGNSSMRTLEKITIEVFSYKQSIEALIMYVDNITDIYKKNIAEDRKTKQFIYSAIKTVLKEDENRFNLWDEQEFHTNRRFSNIFLENKTELLSKVDFFLENKAWYDERGIPYNLGIGLHGPPGTGKTSFIKALAQKTKRDIVIIPLKIIQTKADLEKLFFEKTYNRNNQENSKPFDKKIILFEDIDCIGDIVHERSRIDVAHQVTPPSETITETQQLIQSIHRAVDVNIQDQKAHPYMFPSIQHNNPLTLDDFLNLWDGVRETPGRIIIITSNHYDKLDSALIRPGRIDITYEFKLVNHIMLQEMHECFFKKKIPESTLNSIESYLYSPAEIMNIFMSHRSDEDGYIKRLQKNKK